MRRWPGKSLRIEEAISLIDRLNGIGATCLLLGGRDDAACLDAIAPGLVFFPALYLPWWILDAIKARRLNAPTPPA